MPAREAPIKDDIFSLINPSARLLPRKFACIHLHVQAVQAYRYGRRKAVAHLAGEL